jgi:hypothetical protein
VSAIRGRLPAMTRDRVRILAWQLLILLLVLGA